VDAFIKSIYLGEIQTQCNLALNAVTNLNVALQQLNGDPMQGNYSERHFFHNEVFRSIHSFLTHASNISKLLWTSLPHKKKGETQEQYKNRCNQIKKGNRSRELRETLNLPDDEHALKSRKLRDHLEHFDERLDEWEKSSSNRNYVQDLIGPRGSISGIQDTDMMRWFDPTTNDFLFRGESYNLQVLATAIKSLLTNVIEAANINDEHKSRREMPVYR